MNTPNAELAYAVLDHIDAHPRQWYQRGWYRETDCGTAACFAGWAVLLSGGHIKKVSSMRAVVDAGLGRLNGMEVADAAERLLGTSGFTGDKDQREDLFADFNTREDLGRIAEAIFGPRPGGA